MPDGISHDHPCFASSNDVGIYAKASSLAEQETQVFVQALINQLMATDNRQGVCYLMGLDLSKAPCLSDCAQRAQQTIPIEFPLRYYNGPDSISVTAAGVTQSWNNLAGDIDEANIYGVGVIYANNTLYPSMDIKIMPTPHSTGSYQGVGEMQNNWPVMYGKTAFYFPNLEYAISSPNQISITSFQSLCKDPVANTELNTFSGTIDAGLINENPNVDPSDLNGSMSGEFGGSEYVCKAGTTSTKATAGQFTLHCK